MKAVFSRIRFSRKFVLSLGCVLLLGGATGVAAVFVGTERLLGPSWQPVNGLSCTAVQTVAIRKNGVFWIRKFVRTQGGDGPARLRTAIRVAKTIQERDKPDLVQVSVLDSKGPQLRSEMRGRAIAAQVVHIADPGKVPEGSDGRRFTAFYLEGEPNPDGHFYGLKMDIPLEDIDRIAASITDHSDCVDLNPIVDSHAKAAAHDSGTGGHGEAEKSHDGKSDAHGEGRQGEAPADGAGHAPGGSQEGEARDLLTSTPSMPARSMFSLGYIRSLFFGDEAAASEQATTVPASGQMAHNGSDAAEDDAPHPDIQASAPDAVQPASYNSHRAEPAR